MGELDSRPKRKADGLPWEDPSVDALSADQRADLGSYWSRRAQAELKVARAFSELRADLSETGAAAEVIDLLQLCIENEREHADICWRLSHRYAGHELPRPVMPPSTEFPRMPGVPSELRPTLHAIGLCCVNESIATIWLEHCLAQASSSLVRAVTRLHVADEVSHARVGWAHLGSHALSPSARKEISRWILPVLKANVAQWLDDETMGLTTEVPAHGLPLRSDHRDVVLGVVREVVLPGFAHTGIDATEAARWVESKFG